MPEQSSVAMLKARSKSSKSFSKREAAPSPLILTTTVADTVDVPTKSPSKRGSLVRMIRKRGLAWFDGSVLRSIVDKQCRDRHNKISWMEKIAELNTHTGCTTLFYMHPSRLRSILTGMHNCEHIQVS